MPKKSKTRAIAGRDYAAEVAVILAEAKRLAAELTKDFLDSGGDEEKGGNAAARFLQEDLAGIEDCRRRRDLDGLIVHAVNLGQSVALSRIRAHLKQGWEAAEEDRRRETAKRRANEPRIEEGRRLSREILAGLSEEDRARRPYTKTAAELLRLHKIEVTPQTLRKRWLKGGNR